MQHVGILVAAAAIWSPFAALGMIPVIGWCLTKVRPRDVFSLSNVSSAPVVLLAAAYFLTRSSGGIPAYAIWTEHGFTWSVWAIFIVLEFGALIGAMLFLSRSDAYLLAVMGGFLVLLTLFNVGAFNDLLMRGSIPALGVLALAAANRIAGTPNTGAKTPLIVLLVIGLVTPTGEIMRGLTEKRMTGQRQCTIEQMVAAHKFLTPQYVAFDRELSGMQVEPVLDVLQLPLHRFGIASFDDQSRRIESAEFADAAFVTDEITLPAGIYKLEAVVDWDITAEKPGKNGGHISRHADRILIPLQTSRAAGGRLASYFRSDLKPFRLSFGLGGWAKGKGFLQVKEWKISSVKQKGT